MTPYRGPLTRSPLSLEIININRVGKTEALFDEEAGFASSRVNVIDTRLVGKINERIIVV